MDCTGKTALCIFTKSWIFCTEVHHGVVTRQPTRRIWCTDAYYSELRAVECSFRLSGLYEFLSLSLRFFTLHSAAFFAIRSEVTPPASRSLRFLSLLSLSLSPFLQFTRYFHGCPRLFLRFPLFPTIGSLFRHSREQSFIAISLFLFFRSLSRTRFPEAPVLWCDFACISIKSRIVECMQY